MFQGLRAMKPRQVLLSSSSSSKNPSNGKPLSLTPEQRPLLLQAVCHFLESNGFSKTLKKFLSEASIERDSWKNCLFNLEDAFCMYVDVRSQNKADDNNIKSDEKSEKIAGDDANSKSKEKKKKKSADGSPIENVEIHSKEPEAALEDTSCQEKSTKKAKYKKKKKGSEAAPEPVNEDLQTLCAEGSKGKADPEKSLKSKSEHKKKKESKIVSSTPVDDTEKNGMGAYDDQEENKKSTITRSEDGIEQEKKSSKKRKKTSEENKSNGLVAEFEDSKHRKTGDSGKGESDEQVTKATTVPPALDKQLENGLVDSKTPSSATGKDSKIVPQQNGGDESALKKSSAKKQNGSAEPKALNAFQRVKADNVEFADERLQDNSYWAKDGAEIGYGAKAEEVLGQVRGRDFRHEKTKKKRGSYRGGQIDLQSHSVKFNYSDDDE